MTSEKPSKTHSTTNRIMYCEMCGGHTVSDSTRIRFYPSGRQTERDRCSDCGRVQEMEYWGYLTDGIESFS